VKELIILVKADEIPFTSVANVLVVVESRFEFMIVEVAIDPARLEVKVFADEVKVLATCKLFIAKLVIVALVADKLEMLALVIVALPPTMTLPKIGLSVNIYVTLPVVSVATVRLEFVLDAKKFSKLDMEVVAMIPFMLEVMIPELAESVFAFMILVEVASPLTMLVMALRVENKEF
jgi:hypothetical protein